MSKNNRPTVSKKLQCKKCGNEQTIQRLKSRNREAGHVKHLYCFKCKERTPHTELAMN